MKYALKTGNQIETCEVFDCKRSSLQDWITMYQKTGSPVRKIQKNRIAYKVKQEYIDFLREELPENYFIHAFSVEWLKKDRNTHKKPVKRYK